MCNKAPRGVVTLEDRCRHTTCKGLNWKCAGTKRKLLEMRHVCKRVVSSWNRKDQTILKESRWWSVLSRLRAITGMIHSILKRPSNSNLRGRRSKGKGKGIRAREPARGRREEGGTKNTTLTPINMLMKRRSIDYLSPLRAPHALAHAQIPPSPTHFNAGHAG